MGLSDWIKEKAANLVFGQLVTSFETQPRQGKRHPTDPRSLVGHNKGWAYICASKNAESCAQVPLRLYARGGKVERYNYRTLSRERKAYLETVTKQDMGDVVEIERGHPLTDLLDKINPHMTRFQFIELSILWQELTGDAYWYAEPGPMGIPQNLWPLPAQYMRIVPDVNDMIAGYLFTKDNVNPSSFAVEEVVHTQYANPNNLWYGLSPMEAALGAITLLEAQQGMDRDLFENGGVPQVGLIYKQQLSTEQRERLYAEWRKRFGSRVRGEKAIVLAGGDDIKSIGYPPKELGSDLTRLASLEEVAGAFGVPMTIIKTNESNLASAQAGWYQYQQGTIKPKLERFQGFLTEQLAQRYFDERLFLAFDDCVPGDKTYRLQEITTRLNAQMTTVNEERAIDGLEPVAWGDVPVQVQAAERQAELMASRLEAAEREPKDENEAVPEKMLKSLNEVSFEQMLTEHIVRVAEEVDARLADG